MGLWYNRAKYSSILIAYVNYFSFKLINKTKNCFVDLHFREKRKRMPATIMTQLKLCVANITFATTAKKNYFLLNMFLTIFFFFLSFVQNLFCLLARISFPPFLLINFYGKYSQCAYFSGAAI